MTRQGSVYITDNNVIKLLPPSEIGEPVEYYQILTGSFLNKSEMIAEAYLTANTEVLDLLLLSTTGQTIASFAWDGEFVKFSSPFIPASSIKPEYVLMDLQMAFYKESSIKNLIEESGLSFKYEDTSDSTIRTVMNQNKVIWTAIRAGNNLVVNNYLRNYKYDIEILQ